MKTLLCFLMFLATIVFSYYLIRKIIILYSGCNNDDADEIIQQAIAEIYSSFSGKIPYHISNDKSLEAEIWNIYGSILGEQRFETLKKLTQSTTVSLFACEGNIRYFACTIIDPDEREKKILEASITAIFKKYLSCHGMPTITLIQWQQHSTLKFPILSIKYAETQKELRLLQALVDSENEKELQQYNEIFDEEDDLSE